MFDSAHQNDNFWSQSNKIKDKSINHKVNVSKNETQPWLRRYWDSVFISADKFDWSVIQNESCHTVVTSISRCQGLPTTQFISYNGLFVIQPTEGSEVARRSWVTDCLHTACVTTEMEWAEHYVTESCPGPGFFQRWPLTIPHSCFMIGVSNMFLLNSTRVWNKNLNSSTALKAHW